MVRIERNESDWLGIALAAVGGLMAGVIAGAALGEMLGDLSPARLRGVARRLRPSKVETFTEDPRLLRNAIAGALADHPDTQGLAVTVEALGDGMVELTGIAPDPISREVAGAVAREVPGAGVVVNRLLVEGTDVPEQTSSPPSAG